MVVWPSDLTCHFLGEFEEISADLVPVSSRVFEGINPLEVFGSQESRYCMLTKWFFLGFFMMIH